MNKTTIKVLISLSLAITALSSFAEGGAADAGGTKVRQSTIAQVERAFNRVLFQISKGNRDFSNPFLLVANKLSEIGNRDAERDFILKAITPKSLKEEILEREGNILLAQADELSRRVREQAEIDNYSLLFIELRKKQISLNRKIQVNLIKSLKILDTLNYDVYFTADRFIIEKDNSCTDLHGNIAAAAVTELNSNGKICISFLELTKIQPHELANSIMGIMFHELAHLSGMGEDDALKSEELYYEFSEHVTQAGVTPVSSQYEYSFMMQMVRTIHALEFVNNGVEETPESMLISLGKSYAYLDALSLQIPIYGFLPGALELSFKAFLPELSKILSHAKGEIYGIPVGMCSEEVRERVATQEKIMKDIFSQIFPKDYEFFF